jgi:hypothetical protein
VTATINDASKGNRAIGAAERFTDAFGKSGRGTPILQASLGHRRLVEDVLKAQYGPVW